MIPTVRFQILKCCRGNCMRLLWSCTRYGALHPISGHYTRSERVQCSLIGRTISSATSSIADTLPRRNGTPRLSPIPHADAPAKTAYLTPKHRPRSTSMTAHQPFRQSADPLSQNSQNSRNFGEWVCGLAKAPTGNHYSHVHQPTQPASNNQPTTLKLVPKWCYTT